MHKIKFSGMLRSRIQKFFMSTVLLFPGTIYLLLLIYKSFIPWCEDMQDYPIKGDLRNISLGNKLYRGNKEIEPINVRKFKFIHQPNQTCSASKIHVLCLVKSAPGRAKMRDTIRKTWGKVVSSSGNILIFSLGENKDYKDDIHAEAKTYRDILQGDFEDTYNNLTLKTIMGIQWISTFCSSAAFVFLVDDDVMINFHNLLKFTSSISNEEMSNLFSGCVHGSSLPIRNKSKWFISRNDFPFPCYPTYVSGTAIVTTGQVIQKFNAAIPYVKFLVFEDVFLGIVAWKLGIQPRIENSKFDFDGKSLYRLPCIISSHRQRIDGDVYQKKYESLIHQPCTDWTFKI